jgi:hypothetical protein
MELTEGSETSANHNLTPGKYPKERIEYSKYGESIKYCPQILLLVGIVYEMELSCQSYLIRDTSQQQYWWTIPDAVNTVMCS